MTQTGDSSLISAPLQRCLNRTNFQCQNQTGTAELRSEPAMNAPRNARSQAIHRSPTPQEAKEG